MSTILYIILALVVVLILGPAVFADRSPIPETSGNVHKISKTSELDALLSSTTYVVIDFYADWCPPCRAIAPIFSQLADDHASQGKLAFAKVNVDHVKDVAQRFSISAMPTFLFLKDGKPTSVSIGKKKQGSSTESSASEPIERVLGADATKLRGAVQTLAEQVQNS